MEITDAARTAFTYLPFIGATAIGNDMATPLITRIIEQVAVGAIVAALVIWRNDSIQETAIKNLTVEIKRQDDTRREEISEIKKIMTQMQRDLYEPRRIK